MMFLSIATMICLGLLAGVEFAVSAFVNPVLWQMEPRTQARLIQTFARNLGGVMPFWYGLNLFLMIVACVLHRNTSGLSLLIAASAIWVAVIVLTLLFLVPLNSRLARLEIEDWTEETRREHRKWDTWHRYRIVALVAAWSCFLLAIQS